MSCEPEKITGLVDGVLDAETRAAAFAHLATCPACREQADFERELRARMRGLPLPEPRPGFEADVRRSLAARRRLQPLVRVARVLLPLAATLAVFAIWMRTSPAALARELAFDHAKCFRREALPAKVWGNDPEAVLAWFEKQGTPMPSVPAQAAGVELQGARYCPLADGTLVAHLYYTSRGQRVSLFVVPRGMRTDRYATHAMRHEVRLVGLPERTLGVVGDRSEQVDAFAQALLSRSARLAD